MQASSAVRAYVTSRAEKMFTGHTIRIRYDDAIRPNTNRLFRPLFGTEANTNRIFGASVISMNELHFQSLRLQRS